jgi:hypothetical protein
MAERKEPYKSQVWQQAKEDFREGARSVKEHLSAVKVEAQRHWSYIKEEIREGSGGLWQEFRLQVRQIRTKWRTRRCQESESDGEQDLGGGSQQQ